jgi:hypothetical protein
VGGIAALACGPDLLEAGLEVGVPEGEEVGLAVLLQDGADDRHPLAHGLYPPGEGGGGEGCHRDRELRERAARSYPLLLYLRSPALTAAPPAGRLALTTAMTKQFRDRLALALTGRLLLLESSRRPGGTPP